VRQVRQGWIVRTEGWVDLGQPISIEHVVPSVGVVTEVLVWKRTMTEEFEAIWMAVQDEHGLEFIQMASSFHVQKGNNLQVSISRPFHP